MNLLTKNIRKLMGWCPNLSSHDTSQKIHQENSDFDTLDIRQGGNDDMNISKSTLAIFGLVLISFILSIYFYPQVPEKVATHWNSQGEVNGYMSKFWGLFFMPVLITGITALLLVIPRIDPKKENIKKFRKYYDGFVIILLLFMVVLHFQVLLWNIGIRTNPIMLLSVGLGLLFYYTGILTENAERNWFVGVRTPWTLSSDRVWKKTNHLGGILFKLAGIVSILGIFFTKYAIFFVIVPVLLITGFSIAYSYLEYQKELKHY